jgi:sulfide:quinone oxidoreductase
MKRLVILGAGTGGTLLANRARRELPHGWCVTVVDPELVHVYQPGLLFLPFGARDEEAMLRPRGTTLSPGIEWKQASADHVDTTARRVRLEDGDHVDYDILVVASGARLRPDLTPGLVGERYGRDIFDFYTLEGAQALRERLDDFRGGRLVVNVVEMPIKCPVAPLEFVFLADDFFTRRGIRDRMEIVYVTPLDGAFTRPVASKTLGHLLRDKNIAVEPEFMTGEIDADGRVIKSYDGREVAYDLLVTVPTHSGAAYVERSGFGNELAFVPTDPHTLAAKGLDNVFVLGDATDLPASKAGSVAHFEGEALAANLLRVAAGKDPLPTFDGHAICFVETGHDKAMLIDFNYETQPLPGRFPVPGVGPLSLLKESRLNHWGKLAFRPVYWNALLPGRPLPLPTELSLAGKDTRAERDTTNPSAE